jgi:hypothetical protein
VSLACFLSVVLHSVAIYTRRSDLEEDKKKDQSGAGGMAGWLRQVTSPFRRMWDVVLTRLHPHKRKRGNGMRKLYNDVVSCGYEDVHVMWSMLQHPAYPALGSPKGGRNLSRDYALV